MDTAPARGEHTLCVQLVEQIPANLIHQHTLRLPAAQSQDRLAPPQESPAPDSYIRTSLPVSRFQRPTVASLQNTALQCGRARPRCSTMPAESFGRLKTVAWPRFGQSAAARRERV